jgi:hypothetical protein
VSKDIVERLHESWRVTGEPIYQESCAEIKRLRLQVSDLEDKLDESQIRSIEARNPGIDLNEVRYFRTFGHMKPKEVSSDGMTES